PRGPQLKLPHPRPASGAAGVLPYRPDRRRRRSGRARMHCRVTSPGLWHSSASAECGRAWLPGIGGSSAAPRDRTTTVGHGELRLARSHALSSRSLGRRRTGSENLTDGVGALLSLASPGFVSLSETVQAPLTRSTGHGATQEGALAEASQGCPQRPLDGVVVVEEERIARVRVAHVTRITAAMRVRLEKRPPALRAGEPVRARFLRLAGELVGTALCSVVLDATRANGLDRLGVLRQRGEQVADRGGRQLVVHTGGAQRRARHRREERLV